MIPSLVCPFVAGKAYDLDRSLVLATRVMSKDYLGKASNLNYRWLLSPLGRIWDTVFAPILRSSKRTIGWSAKPNHIVSIGVGFGGGNELVVIVYLFRLLFCYWC